MLKKVFELPAMYGDHHVLEVRRLLMEIPGVQDVYASAAFQMAEVSYDEHQVNDLEIAMKLDDAGYLGEWTTPLEASVVPTETGARREFTRYAAVYEATRQVVSFTQNVAYTGRPLWTCPGMGLIKSKMED